MTRHPRARPRSPRARSREPRGRRPRRRGAPSTSCPRPRTGGTGARPIAVAGVEQRHVREPGRGVRVSHPVEDRAHDLRRVLGREDHPVELRERGERCELAPQSLRHLVERAGELAELVVALQVEPRMEVVLRDPARALREQRDRSHDVARLTHREPRHQQQRDRHDRYVYVAELHDVGELVGLGLARDDHPVGRAQALAHELGP